MAISAAMQGFAKDNIDAISLLLGQHMIGCPRIEMRFVQRAVLTFLVTRLTLTYSNYILLQAPPGQCASARLP